MHRNKLKSHNNKQQNLTRDVRDNYLPRTESSLNILDDFDDIGNITRQENVEQVRELSDKDLTKRKKYKLHLNSNPDVRKVSSLQSTESVLSEVCSLQGISEDKHSTFSSCNLEETECSITAAECYLYCSDMESFTPRNKRQISRPIRTETEALESEFKTGSSVFNRDDREQRHYSRKDLLRTRVSKDNETTAACLPLLLRTSWTEKAWNLSENRKISKGRRQGSKNYRPSETRTMNGKELSSLVAPEYHNLRPYLPLLTICQCPDYDSAVIEVVRDYNDPSRGVGSLIYPTSNP